MTRGRRLLAVMIVSLMVACDPGPRADAPATPTARPGRTVTVDPGDRPFQLHVPGAYHPGKRAPLVVLLHGFRASAAIQESYFRLTAESDRRGFLYAMPDGTKNRNNQQFWNATQSCCDVDRTGVDDSAYLRRLIDTVKASYSVDAARVYLVGHSNGGFMAYRMACDHAAEITAIVSLAGAATDDDARCRPERAVSVLQIHGTDDRSILFDGGAGERRAYPSVAETLGRWRRHNGCADRADPAAAPIDLDTGLPGAETTVMVYRDGCRDGTRVELWTIQDGGHIPPLTADFAPAVVDFLLDQVSAPPSR